MFLTFPLLTGKRSRSLMRWSGMQSCTREPWRGPARLASAWLNAVPCSAVAVLAGSRRSPLQLARRAGCVSRLRVNGGSAGSRSALSVLTTAAIAPGLPWQGPPPRSARTRPAGWTPRERSAASDDLVTGVADALSPVVNGAHAGFPHGSRSSAMRPSGAWS